MKRSLLCSCAAIGSLAFLLPLPSAAMQVPECVVSMHDDGTTSVSVPEGVSPATKSVAWVVDGSPIADDTRSVTFHMSPWFSGTPVVAAGDGQATLCRSTLGRPSAAQVQGAAPTATDAGVISTARRHAKKTRRARTEESTEASVAPLPSPPPPPPPPGAAAGGGAGRTPASAAAASNAATIIDVYFATEREPKPGATLAFSSTRSIGPPIRYGVASVSIPPNHRPGSIELSWWAKHVSDNPLTNFSHTLALCSTPDEFYSRIAAQLNDHGSGKQIFVFIHGFNNSFQEELYRTAQLAYDAGFDGAPIMYDWPSNDSVVNYTADRTAIEASTRQMRDFIVSIATKTGADKVNLIAHSMGNRGMLQALDMLRADGNLPQLNQVILAAPDIDTSLFTQIAPALLGTGKIGRMTLYASHKDRAMLASLKENKAYPVGGLPPITVVSGIDTIDVTAVEGNWLGHDYFVSAVPVIEDISSLLRDGTAPPRTHVVHAGDAAQTYWAFSP